jgi:hypothetical protein
VFPVDNEPASCFGRPPSSLDELSPTLNQESCWDELVDETPEPHPVLGRQPTTRTVLSVLWVREDMCSSFS